MSFVRVGGSSWRSVPKWFWNSNNLIILIDQLALQLNFLNFWSLNWSEQKIELILMFNYRLMMKRTFLFFHFICSVFCASSFGRKGEEAPNPPADYVPLQHAEYAKSSVSHLKGHLIPPGVSREQISWVYQYPINFNRTVKIQPYRETELIEYKPPKISG